MKLSQLAAKPQLVKVVLDDQDTLEQFGEALEFYTWDRQPMEVLLKWPLLTAQIMLPLLTQLKHLFLMKKAKKFSRTMSCCLPQC